MEEVKDIQEQLLDGVRMQLKEGEKLAAVLQDTLFLSADAVYRKEITLQKGVQRQLKETCAMQSEHASLSFDCAIAKNSSCRPLKSGICMTFFSCAFSVCSAT